MGLKVIYFVLHVCKKGNKALFTSLTYYSKIIRVNLFINTYEKAIFILPKSSLPVCDVMTENSVLYQTNFCLLLKTFQDPQAANGRCSVK